MNARSLCRAATGFAAMLFVAAAARGGAAGEDRLVVHEWGTFTSLQDEQGRDLPGVNVDDEPVPPFVHNLNRFLLASPVLTSEHWRYRMKGAPRRHPQVTMRLETPVIYFYPPAGAKAPLELDIEVQFRGGWLTEFYPKALADMDRPGGYIDFGNLTPETVGNLKWLKLKVGAAGEFPKTEEHVWLAPRKVNSAPVTAANGESEQYLFYRGVANLQAPLRTVMDRARGEITIHHRFDAIPEAARPSSVRRMWLVDIRGADRVAFREIRECQVSVDGSPLAMAGYRFEGSDYDPQNLAQLKSRMHAALVADGLFDDEATAMLSTWRQAYFQGPGLRLFYIVPRQWTDHYLPLKISRPAKVERVMLGRIELVTADQRRELERLSRLPTSSPKWIDKIPRKVRDQFLAGRIRGDFGRLETSIPADYQAYLNLGRFRNALVVEQERWRQ